MAGDRIGGTVMIVFPNPRTQHPGPDKGQHAARHVHHRGTGKIYMPVTQAEILAQHRQPAAAPDPVTVDRINNRSHKIP